MNLLLNHTRYILVFLFISWSLNAQVALPTFHGVQTTPKGLYSFSSHTFTNCGATGRSGPTLANCKSSYDVSWENNTNYFNVPSNAGIQYWTVPITGTYRIEIYGAQGANPGSTSYQKGARMRGDFDLSEGDVLKILVGQMGLWGPSNGNNSCSGINNAGGGGGGTFVVKSDDTRLIIAGAGGGYNNADNSYTNATTATSGITPTGTSGDGGINGGGGGAGTNGNAGNGSTAGGNGSSCAYGAGGGSFYSNGGKNCSGNNNSQGNSFLNGGLGGESVNGCINSEGGFGGGGSGGHRSGGGGGYSGGGGGAPSGGGGGGGSYNSGSSQSNTAGVREDHGQVIITLN